LPSEEVPPPPEPEPRPNFCTRCGERWDPSWTECPRCAQATARPVAKSPLFRRSPLRPALSLYFALLGCSVIAFALVRTGEMDQADAEILITVAMSVLVVVWVMASFRRVAPGLVRLGEGKWYIRAVVLGCVTFILAFAAVKLVVAALDVPQISGSGPLLKAGYGWWVVILTVCVQPAVIEELAFRGVLLAGLQPVLGMRDAVIVSALMFMILHLTVLSFPHLLLIGLVLGWMRVRSGSLYPGMVLHFTHNLLVVLQEALEKGGGL